MPQHPAAPEDFPGLVEAYRQATQAVIDLGHSCSDADFDRPTAAPGWTVKDQVAHVVGLESWMRTGSQPRVDVPDYPHVRNDLGRFTEVAVEQRRRVRGDKVVAELETVLAQRMDDLTGGPDATEPVDSTRVVRTPLGDRPLIDALRIRTLDIWTHEQDIRQALGRPGDLDSGGAAVFVDVLFSVFPRLVARDAAVPPGNVVILEVTGPVKGRAGVWVEQSDDGKPRGIPLFSGVAHDGDPDDVFTTITASTDAVTRRAAGRGTVDDIHWTAQGDEDVARRVLENLVFVD
jgi:uncharacterized protein (TIGR03083 family)